jgi:hypothetical protein
MNDEPHLSRLFRHDPTQLLAPRSAWSKSFDDFIGVYSVSIVFSIDGRSDESYELIWDAPMCERAFWLSPNGYEIRELPDFEPATMVVICPDNTHCGFYSGGCLWVDESHRGQGLGAELVLAMSEALEASPTAYHGGLGFTRAGLDAHFNAWVRAVIRARDAGNSLDASILEHALTVAGHVDSPCP